MNSIRSGALRLRQRVEYETASINRLTDKVNRIEEEQASLQKARGLIDRCIELVSANGIGKIESIVTAGLQQVFKDEKDPIFFIVEKKESARGTSYQLLCKQGSTVGNPMRSFGGGVQNLCAFLLRLIMIKRFKLAKALFLDEAFNNVNGVKNQIRLSRMLHTLANDFGFMILAITDQKRIAEAATNIYKLVPGDPPTLQLRTYDAVIEEETKEQIVE